MDNFKFQFELRALNELGRNLYKKPTTILGEAISNAWDADAKRVDIRIDEKNNRMIIKDDGCGMDEKDFQNKFLKIAYAKRMSANLKEDKFESDKFERPYIGRKGIGKLALLSCSDKLYIISKKEGAGMIKMMISNTKLDEIIDRGDSDPNKDNKYIFTEKDDENDFNENDYAEDLKDFNQGTFLMLSGLREKINTNLEYYKKAIAFYFKFSIKDPSFEIYINGEVTNIKHLEDLMEKTEIVWLFNDFEDDYLERLWALPSKKNAKYLKIKIPEEKINPENINVRGFIASVKKPENLKVDRLEEPAFIDFFVNGRLRANDILKDKTSARIVKSYLYGQIHFDQLDGPDKPEIATASREDILPDNAEYNGLIDNLANIVNKFIFKDWNRIRKLNKQPEKNKGLLTARKKSEEFFNAVIGGYEIPKEYNEMLTKLNAEIFCNLLAYTHCYISENLLRGYMLQASIPLSKKSKEKIATYRKGEEKNKKRAKLNIEIREHDGGVNYLSMDELAHEIDSSGKSHGTNSNFVAYANMYRPIRHAVMHTAFLTKEAQKELSETNNKIQNQMNDILKPKKPPFAKKLKK